MDQYSQTNDNKLHFSSMRTARALTVSPRMLFAGGWGCLLPGVSAHRGRGVCSGGVCSQGGLLPGGVCSRGGVSTPRVGCLLPGRSAPGGVCSQGCVSAPGGSALGECLLCGVGDIPACTEADTPL